ncbi:uncharacterized protein [Amphiura filiformis]|uniref:uncharacterized protein n=1 Tax=Amphiura filiformis TaxID=82378 RepID=UPI003B20F280
MPIRYVSQLDEVYCCPGFSQTDTSCSKACDLGRFGENCTQICTCSAHASLYASLSNSAVTGKCECAPGRQGANCTDVCQGTYGVNCRGTCDCNTADSEAKCDPVDGSCTCSSFKYYGDNCEFRYDSTTASNLHTNTMDTNIKVMDNKGNLTISVVLIVAVVCTTVGAGSAIIGFWLFSRKRRLRENITETSTGPIYDIIQDEHPRVVHDSTTGITSTNPITHNYPLSPITHTYMDRIENTSDLGNILITSSEPVAYAESTGVPESTSRLDTITHTYMDRSQNVSPEIHGTASTGQVAINVESSGSSNNKSSLPDNTQKEAISKDVSGSNAVYTNSMEERDNANSKVVWQRQRNMKSK